MAKVAVTGADGFIGSHVVEDLVRAGFDVRAMVQYNSLDSWGWLDHCDADVAGGFQVLPGDVRDPSSVDALMSGVDAVIHMAALIAIPYSYVAPRSYLETNALGTLNVLESARKRGVGRIVHTSTSEVYGSALRVPMDESHPLNAQSPYAASKIAADQLAQSYACSFDLPVVTIRPFNCFGRRQSTRALIPTIVTQALSKSGTLRLGSTRPTRDFTYVTETARAFRLALTAPEAPGETFNIGCNFEVSVATIVEMVADYLGIDAKIQVDNERLRPESSEVDRLWCDSSKANSILGWSPELPYLRGFQSGLEKTIAWFGTPGNLERYRLGAYTR